MNDSVRTGFFPVMIGKQSEMIERVARAIFAKDAEISRAYDMFGSNLWEDHGRRHPAYLAFARAAIEAMREPTQEMIEAVGGIEVDATRWDDQSYSPPEIWRDMIDEGLK